MQLRGVNACKGSAEKSYALATRTVCKHYLSHPERNETRYLDHILRFKAFYECYTRDDSGYNFSGSNSGLILMTTVLTIDNYYNIIVNVFKQERVQALGSPSKNLTLHYFILYN